LSSQMIDVNNPTYGEEAIQTQSEKISFPISLRLYAVLGFLLLLIAAIAGVAYLQINALHEAAAEESKAIVVSQIFNEIEARLLSGYEEEKSYVVMHDITSQHIAEGLSCGQCHGGGARMANAQQREASLQAMVDAETSWIESQAELDRYQLDDEKQAYKLELETLLNQTASAWDEIVNFVSAGKIEEAQGYHEAVVAPLVTEIIALYDEQIRTSITEATVASGERVNNLAASGISMIIGLSIGAMICGLLGSIITSRSISKPIKTLTNAARSITRGDLEIEAHVNTKDELGVLAKAFNQMTTRLRSMLNQEQQQRGQLEQLLEQNRESASTERKQREQLEQLLKQFREVANDLSSASAEILAATTQQASGATEQSAAITQTTSTVNEVKTISEHSSGRLSEIAMASQRTIDVTRSGQESVQDMIESMAQIKERVEAIAENTLALSEQTQQISEIITTVNEIAAQSNILALNASVEAARAGEHGKGFAVVAMEVRNLAEQSKQATAQVRTILSEIQKATNLTVMATEEGAKGVDEGVQLAAQARESIEKLGNAVKDATQIATQVVAGGQQLQTGIEQIAMAIQQINQVTLQNLTSTSQTENAAQDLNQMALKLNALVQEYKS
jgi:methyl-accepting chemotaxis protein